jgi:hypothetical protein
MHEGDEDSSQSSALNRAHLVAEGLAAHEDSSNASSGGVVGDMRKAVVRLPPLPKGLTITRTTPTTSRSATGSPAGSGTPEVPGGKKQREGIEQFEHGLKSDYILTLLGRGRCPSRQELETAEPVRAPCGDP